MNNLEKSIKRIKVFFFLFVFVQGIFYLFLIPPWQSPDETHHFEYIGLLAKNKELTPTAYENLDKKIIESMDTFHMWKYQSICRPHPLPHRLIKIPFFGRPGPVTYRAPFYYHLSSFILKGLKIDDILNQFYLIRIFSFLFFLLIIYFTYLSAKFIFKDNDLACLASAFFVASLPQFLIINTSVNPINLAVFLETILIYLIFLSLYRQKNLFIAFLAPIIITISFLSHRVALFLLPPFFIFLLIYFIKSLKNKRDLLKFFFVLLIIIILLLAVLIIANHLFPDAVSKSIRESSVKSRTVEINRFIHFLSSRSTKNFSIFLEGIFKSFCYFAGWMRFPYLLDIYSILKLICLLSLLGLTEYPFFFLFKKNYRSIVDLGSFFILCVAALPIITATIIRDLPQVETAQGRYIFPAISALAILFVLGLKEIVPKRFEKWVPIIIIIGFIVLNIYTIFNSLIRVFYYFTNA